MQRPLSDLLWHERDLLETLRYRLEVEHLLLGAGRTDRLPIASREVEDMLTRIRAAELARTAEVAGLAVALGLAEDASLLQIAEAVPPPWDGIFREHRTALLTLMTEIGTIAETNRDVLASAHHATQETLLSLHESVDVYDQRGGASRGPATSRILDKSL